MGGREQVSEPECGHTFRSKACTHARTSSCSSRRRCCWALATRSDADVAKVVLESGVVSLLLNGCDGCGG